MKRRGIGHTVDARMILFFIEVLERGLAFRSQGKLFGIQLFLDLDCQKRYPHSIEFQAPHRVRGRGIRIRQADQFAFAIE
jgi:hypothetical protein